MSANRAATMHDYERHYEYVASSGGHANGNSNETSIINGKASLDYFIYELKQRHEEEMSHATIDGQVHLTGAVGEHLSDASLSSDRYLNRIGEQSSHHPPPPSHPPSHHHQQPKQHQLDHVVATSFESHQVLLSQLAKKEKDLILAAELGKALLDRNEELTKTNEQINEEYTRNLELLEQEKYALRKKLNSVEIEYENKVLELQTDLSGLRDKLNNHLEISRENEGENNRIIDELTEQNQRLTNELKKSSNRESILEKEIQSLKEQFHARRTNFTDHIGQLEGLRDEINLLSRRKLELESKISSLNDEKESISISLDESQYRILSMEKQLHEKELFIQNQQKDLDELRRVNTQYQNRLESYMKMRTFEAYKVQGSSLYNEIEMSSHSSGDENMPNYLSEEDGESSPDNMCCHCAKQKQDMFELYCKLKNLYDDLSKRRIMEANVVVQLNTSSNSNHDSGIQTNLGCIDELNYIICEIQELIKSIDLMQCVTCQEFAAERNELERLRKDNNSSKEQIQKLNNEVMAISSSSTIIESELNAIKEENKVLKDDVDNIVNLSKDEIVRRAWKVRDDTIARKKSVEIELAKVRIELMHVNSQLLETIQQKVELSQQLEQWQVDMEQLIEEQLKNKLSLQEKMRTTTANEANTPKKETNLFDRLRLPKFANALVLKR